MSLTATSRVTSLAQKLIQIDSITPNDGGCQNVVRRHLERAGFTCESMDFHDVTNLWAYRGELSSKPLIVFAGHTDVVPPGPLENWTYNPFEGHIDDDILHGRGAVDMKGETYITSPMTNCLKRSDHENILLINHGLARWDCKLYCGTGRFCG